MAIVFGEVGADELVGGEPGPFEMKVVEQRVVGGSHLRLRLRSADGERSLGGIAFRQSLPDDAGDRLRLVYRLEVNDFRGRREAQLNVIQMQAIE